MAVPSPGQKAPAFQLKATDGKTHKLSDIGSGELGVIAFYKYNCPTCQLAMPFVEKLAAHHRGHNNVHVWAVAQDPKAEVEAFSREYGITCPTLIDDTPYKVSADYDLSIVPTVFLVDGEGTVQQTIVSFSKSEYEELAKRLGEQTGKRPAPLFEGANVPETKPG